MTYSRTCLACADACLARLEPSGAAPFQPSQAAPPV